MLLLTIPYHLEHCVSCFFFFFAQQLHLDCTEGEAPICERVSLNLFCPSPHSPPQALEPPRADEPGLAGSTPKTTRIRRAHRSDGAQLHRQAAYPVDPFRFRNARIARGGRAYAARGKVVPGLDDLAVESDVETLISITQEAGGRDQEATHRFQMEYKNGGGVRKRAGRMRDSLN